MELRHLRYFLAVSEELHFGRAARALGIQQPPLSQQIRALEDELGVKLFDRSSRRVRLTAAGEALRPAAQRALDAADAARRTAQRAGRGDTGELALGFVGTATLTLLPKLLRSFREHHPDVALTLHEMTTAEQLRALHAGNLDVGLVRPPLPGAETVHCVPLGTERLLAALPVRHPLARERAVAVERLAGEPFVLFPRALGPGLYDQILNHCRSHGVEPAITQEAVQMHTLAALVAAGLGVSIVPSSVSQLHRADVAYRPLSPQARVAHLAAAHRHDNLNPAAHNFAALARRPNFG
ncbi:LysR family transcriptional regulator [Amycolatopsis anabasis]|uniref:LysR family transcriptional regulator n=1 Tax=Amycolatopsis anabasis TaxID=1840409 RepID=UPI00131B2C41|nr:LysR family transcriptional regulator [Amycolatopsis anabasis]